MTHDTWRTRLRRGLPLLPIGGAATEENIGLDIPPTIDKRLDGFQVTQPVSTLNVIREGVTITGAEAYLEIARVLNANPASGDYALAVRPLQGFASATPMFTDPIDRALRDGGKVDIAAFDAALPAGANNIGKVDARVRNAADSGYIEPATLGEQQTQTTALQIIDDIAHALNAAFVKAAAIAGQFDDTTPTAATEDNVAPVRITAQRGLHVNLRDAAGAALGAAAASPLLTRLSDGAAAYDAAKTGQLPGALVGGRLDVHVGAQGLTVEVQGDAAHDDPVAGNPLLLGARASAATPANVTADGDVARLWADLAGRLYTRALGDVAHDAVDAGDPLKVGGKATSTAPTAVATNDRVNAYFDLVGRQIIQHILAVADPVAVDGTAAPIKYAVINATADGDNTIVTAVGGKKIRVLGYLAVLTGAGTALLQDTAATPVVHGRVRAAADGGGAVYAGGFEAPAFETAVGTGVEINNPTGVDSLGHMTYVEV